MEIKVNPPVLKGANEDIVLALKGVLADEYVLLNKTSYCLLDASSPFINDTSSLFQKIDEHLKENTETITELLKQRCSKLSLSINDIISNTQLENLAVFESKVAAIEILLDDHLKVINQLESTMRKFSKNLEEDELLVLKHLKQRHVIICNKFRRYLKDIFNYSV